MTLERPLRIDLRSEWKPEVRTFQPRLEEFGIEHLAFEFPDEPYLGHFTEKGFNAIHINGVAHSWVRNVLIRNADSGIALGGSVFVTLTGIVIESERRAENPHDATGHHAISMLGLDCLCTDFDIATKFIHDLTVSGGSVGCVFSNGKAPDMSLDHHRAAPYENLFSNLDLGRGERMFLSGGRQAIGRHAAAGNTFWNLATKSSVEMPEGFGPSRLNFIGVKIRGVRGMKAESEWVETIRPGSLQPADLHAAQLTRRLGGSESSEVKKDVVHNWTNTEGKTIAARFEGLEGQAVVLILDGEQTIRYPLNKLSAESQALAKKLANP